MAGRLLAKTLLTRLRGGVTSLAPQGRSFSTSVVTGVLLKGLGDEIEILAEIRPYLAGTGGGEIEVAGIDGPIVKVQISGPAAEVMTVRVAITQKLREKIPEIAAVQLL